MASDVQRYQSKKWQGVQDPATRDALADQAQKLEALARTTLPGVVPLDGMIMSFQPCPPGWELVLEMEGRVPLGTVPQNQDVGDAAGTMTHSHTIPQQAATSTGNTSIDGHTHSIAADGAHEHFVFFDTDNDPMVNAADSSVSYVDSVEGQTSAVNDHAHGGATGGTAGTSHNHTIAAHNHGGATGAGDHTPAHVKVYFCRRITPEAR